MPAAASGVRITYSDLPTTIREWVAGLLGGPVVLAQSQPGGFSPGTADRLETGAGIRGFLKAVSPAQNEHTPDIHRREADVVEQFPGSRRTPRLLGRCDDGNWVALLFEDVEGRTPQLPWVAAEMRSAIDALSELAEALTPSRSSVSPAWKSSWPMTSPVGGAFAAIPLLTSTRGPGTTWRTWCVSATAAWPRWPGTPSSTWTSAPTTCLSAPTGS